MFLQLFFGGRAFLLLSFFRCHIRQLNSARQSASLSRSVFSVHFVGMIAAGYFCSVALITVKQFHHSLRTRERKREREQQTKSSLQSQAPTSYTRTPITILKTQIKI